MRQHFNDGYLAAETIPDRCEFNTDCSTADNNHFFLNIGTGVDQTIGETAVLIKSVIGFTGKILWDNSKPDGTMKKLMDVSKLRTFGIGGFLSLNEGIDRVYAQYLLPS